MVADIGGADGTVLTQLLAGEVDRTGIVLDLPEVVAGAHEVIARAGTTDRIRVFLGDFFDEVPTAEVYVLSAVLHDWDDEHALRILNTIARAASPGAHLVLGEMVIPAGDGHHHAKLADLTMLAILRPGTRRRRMGRPARESQLHPRPDRADAVPFLSARGNPAMTSAIQAGAGPICPSRGGAALERAAV